MDYNILQGATWPIAILAINWCYYERENLWIPVVGGRSLVTYFRGLMTSLVLIGLAMSAFMIAIRALVQMRVDMAELAFMMLAPVGTSVFAAILLTRVRVKPGAFSPGLLVVLFVTFIGGAGIAFAGSLVVGAVGGGSYAVAVIQATITAVIAISVYYVGQLAVSNLSRTFKFQ